MINKLEPAVPINMAISKVSTHFRYIYDYQSHRGRQAVYSYVFLGAETEFDMKKNLRRQLFNFSLQPPSALNFKTFFKNT